MKNRLVFLWAAAIDLALDAVLGSAFLVAFVALFSTGVGLVPVFGVGLAIVLAATSLTRITGWVERERAAALYQVAIVPPSRRVSTRTGGRRFVAQALLDFVDPVTWRTVLHHLVSAVLGGILFALVALGFRLTLRFSDSAAGILVALTSLVAVVAFVSLAGLLDRSLAVGLLGRGRTAELRQRVVTLADAREGAVSSAASERLRIERDLHDGVQPRLVSVAMTLGMARAKFDSDPEAARSLLDQAHAETKASITELRQLARGIHPAVLTDRGLDAALSAVAARCSVPTTIDVALAGRPTPDVEAVIYFTVAEALTNIAKHSRALSAAVAVTQSDGTVTVTITDNGSGGALIGDGLGQGGLAGMRDRVRSAGGTLLLDSPVGGPTTITVEVPCAS